MAKSSAITTASPASPSASARGSGFRRPRRSMCSTSIRPATASPWAPTPSWPRAPCAPTASTGSVFPTLTGPMRVKIKIRHRHEPAWATLEPAPGADAPGAGTRSGEVDVQVLATLTSRSVPSPPASPPFSTTATKSLAAAGSCRISLPSRSHASADASSAPALSKPSTRRVILARHQNPEKSRCLRKRLPAPSGAPASCSPWLHSPYPRSKARRPHHPRRSARLRRQPYPLWPHDRGDQLLLRRRPVCRDGAQPHLPQRLERYPYWYLYEDGNAAAKMNLDKSDRPQRQRCKTSLRIDVAAGGLAESGRRAQRRLVGLRPAAQHDLQGLLLCQGRMQPISARSP